MFRKSEGGPEGRGCCLDRIWGRPYCRGLYLSGYTEIRRRLAVVLDAVIVLSYFSSSPILFDGKHEGRISL